MKLLTCWLSVSRFWRYKTNSNNKRSWYLYFLIWIKMASWFWLIGGNIQSRMLVSWVGRGAIWWRLGVKGDNHLHSVSWSEYRALGRTPPERVDLWGRVWSRAWGRVGSSRAWSWARSPTSPCTRRTTEIREGFKDWKVWEKECWKGER